MPPMIHVIIRKLAMDYGLHIHNHHWLRFELVKFSGFDTSTAAFMIACAWQRRH